MPTATRTRSIRFVILATLSVLLSPSAGAQTDERGRVEGTVTDSVHARPLAGVRVVALGADARPDRRGSASTDSTGSYHIDSLPPGRYLVGFESPLLDSLEITLRPREVAITQGAVGTIDLALPPAARLRSAVCSGATLPKEKGVLYGHVVDAATEAPLAGAVVVAAWRELDVDRKTLRWDSSQGTASDTTDEGGWYRLCGVPTGARLSFQLQHDDRTSPVISTVVDDTLGIVIRHLSLDAGGPTADSVPGGPDTITVKAASGTARLAGVIRGAGDAPLASAEVRVVGTNAIGRSDASGHYSLGDLPAGTQLLEVRRLGYGAVDASFELRSDVTVTGDVRLQRIVNLDSIRVVAVRSRYREFEEHRTHSMFGYFLDPEAMEWERGPSMSDVIRKIPGFTIVGNGLYAEVISSRAPTLRPCKVNIVVNGVPGQAINDVNPQRVGALEAYREGEQAPAEHFNHGGGCGLIVIWTKR
ncbi:MAG: collagen binding domain-containing protein [Gemmatimonadaceae bacterium]